MPPSSNYAPLKQNASESDLDFHRPNSSPQLLRLYKRCTAALTVFLSISLVFNAAALRHAGLVRNIPIPIMHDNWYTNENRTIADMAWSAPELDSEIGLVALTDEYASSKGLLPAQRWPWDSSKGIYILNGFHNLHCLHLIRRTLYEAYEDTPLHYSFEHVLHCMNVLREEVMCNADDTPRYTGRLNAETGKEQPTSGIGQNRMCRDWGKLRDWAIEHSGCYRAINKSDPNFPTIERYKFCPEGMHHLLPDSVAARTTSG